MPGEQRTMQSVPPLEALFRRFLERAVADAACLGQTHPVRRFCAGCKVALHELALADRELAGKLGFASFRVLAPRMQFLGV